MNDLSSTPPSASRIDIEDQRNWIVDHRKQTGMSWSELAKRTGIAQGTISQFGGEHGYAGDEEKVAEKVLRFRQLLAAQASIQVDAPELPGYFETETSKQLTSMLAWAQRGRVVLAALGAGLGKTSAAKQFRACYSNVFLATMTPATAGVNTMQIEVLEALGEKNASGTPQKLSRRIRERVANVGSPLLIVDEAQHLSEKALEEIRGWYDAAGLGIALFGNVGVLQRLQGGNRSDAFAQLFSRVSLKVVRLLPLGGDVDAMAQAWGIFDDSVIAYLRKICMTPGGLRGGTMALELGSMIAASEKKPLALDHLQDAWAQLSSRTVLS